MNLKKLFQDFNPSKFVVYSCVLLFSLLFALRLDGSIQWSYWVVFIPIWLWKLLVIVGASIGTYVWWKNPQYRTEGDSYVQYKSMLISTGLHLLLLMFELLVCDKLERDQQLWVFVFVPLVFMSVMSIGICVWAIKHERSFEMELFCSVNILLFIFLALRLDLFITWSWVIVFIPLWIVMCVALIGVLYAIILAIILIKSPDIIPEQRRGNVFSAVGYTFLVIPLLTFEVLLANRLDHENHYLFIAITVPLYISLLTLICMSFGAKGGNHWWFGIRKDFCLFLLNTCPLLQEYGNISYKIQRNDHPQQQQQRASSSSEDAEMRKSDSMHSRKLLIDEEPRSVMAVISIEMPD
ncbi:transmembrane protein 185A-like [Tubulanus polymorphus]|uniref:transmembrane protein 185A-like n=1 Tax=Tubulanus polymorphus TaxID=672921 RepID=UPI003DA1DD0F